MVGDTMSDNDKSPISAQDAKRLFADWKAAPAIVLAVSGGPDSIALMWLAARWRGTLAGGPRLVAVTVDHGLRAEAAAEAREVKRLARTLDLPHRTMRWTGAKPKTGLPAAARAARYRLLAQAARASGATHILTAHTRDDQAETLLMRLLRGSGIAGLAAMARQSDRDGVLLARPFLHVSKSQLVATLQKAKIGFVDDPSNRDLNFTRPRIRAVMPVLAAEGAERYLALRDREVPGSGFDANAFAAMPEEIRLRLLKRAIDRFGHEGPAELGKVETLLSALDRVVAEKTKGRLPKLNQARLKQTLGGALVSLIDGRIRVEPAPPRRRRPD
jgi:tRNA(Ile)-lysidine synthase